MFEKRLSASNGGLELGICRGKEAGHLGIWGRWDAASAKLEVFQVRLTATSVDGGRKLETWTYTFGPGLDAPFFASLEMPLAMREFIAGADRVEAGGLTVEFLVSGDRKLRQSHRLSDILRCYRLKGQTHPDGVTELPGFSVPDSPSLEHLTHGDLRERSESIRAEIEAQKQKEEEERKQREEEAKKAKEAAAQKAAPSGAPAAGGPTISGGNCALFFGSTTNNTADIAGMIKEELGGSIDHMVNVAECHPDDFKACNVMILGVPTWHIGEMQDDWALVLPKISEFDYTGKKIAVFGLGDGVGYPDTYVDAIQELAEIFEKKGAKLHGLWPKEGYPFKKSKAIRDGKFMGLVIDIENQSDKTPERVKAWCSQIKTELAI